MGNVHNDEIVIDSSNDIEEGEMAFRSENKELCKICHNTQDLNNKISATEMNKKLSSLSEDLRDLYADMVQNGIATDMYDEILSDIKNDEECKPLVDFLRTFPVETTATESIYDTIKRLKVPSQDIFYSRKEISIYSWLEFSQSLCNFKCYGKNHLLKFIIKNIRLRLSTLQGFRSLFMHPICQDVGSPLYNFTDKKLLIFFAEEYNKESRSIFHAYSKKAFAPLPFLYKNKVEYKIPLASFSDTLEDKKSLLSIGRPHIGKSALLNAIFKTEFTKSLIEECDSMHTGVEVVCDSSNFQLGFNIFDVHMDPFDEKEGLVIEDTLYLFKNSMLLIHVVKSATKKMIEEITRYVKIIEKYKWDPNNVLFIIRDYKNKRISIPQIKRILKQYTVVTIPYVEMSDNYFSCQLNVLRRKLFCLMKNVKTNTYISIEISSKEIKNTKIIHMDQNLKLFHKKARDVFNAIPSTSTDLHSILFKALNIRKNIHNLERKQLQLKKSENFQNKLEKMGKIESDIAVQKNMYATTHAHDALELFDECMKYDDTQKLHAFISELVRWQKPWIAPLQKKRNKLKGKLSHLRHIKEKQENDILEKNASLARTTTTGSTTSLNTTTATTTIICTPTASDKIENSHNHLAKQIKDLAFSIKKISDDMDKVLVSIEHFERELIMLYEQKAPKFVNNQDFYNAWVKHISLGREFEFIDGENNQLHYNALHELFDRYQKSHGTISPWVISIIGPQSTGKSTLLNFLFNTAFMASSGRCTQGMNASIFETDYDNAKRILVLDTEGLLSIEKNDPLFDKKVTTLSMALSQVMIVNVMGELNQAMKEILSMSLWAAEQLFTSVNKRPVVFFVLRNMNDTDINKMRPVVDAMYKQLSEVAKSSGHDSVTNIIDYRHDDSYVLMYSAFNTDSLVDTDDGSLLAHYCTVNDAFRSNAEDLLHKIFQLADSDSQQLLGRSPDLLSVLERGKEIWETLNTFTSLLGLASIVEINQRKKIGEIVKHITNIYIEQEFIPACDESTNIGRVDLAFKLRKFLINNVEEDALDRLKAQTENIVITEYEKQTQPQEDSEFPKKLLQEYRSTLLSQIRLLCSNAKDEWRRNRDVNKINKEIKKFKMQMSNLVRTTLEERDTEIENAIKDKNEREKIFSELRKDVQNKLEQLEEKLKEKLEELRKTKEEFCALVYKILEQTIRGLMFDGKSFGFLDITNLIRANVKCIDWIENPQRNQILDFIKVNHNSNPQILQRIFERIFEKHKKWIGFDAQYYVKKASAKKYQSSIGRDTINEIETNDYNIPQKIYVIIRGWVKQAWHDTSDGVEGEEVKNDTSDGVEGEEVKNDTKLKDIKNDTKLKDIKNDTKLKDRITADACFDNELKQLIYPLEKELQTLIETRCTFQAGKSCNISFLRMRLKEIQSNIDIITKKFLKPKKMYFKRGGNFDLNTTILTIIFKNMIVMYCKQQDNNMKNYRAEFTIEKKKAFNMFDAKLRSFIGDEESAAYLKEIFFTNILKDVQNFYDATFLNEMRRAKINPTTLCEKGDAILNGIGTNAFTLDRDKFIQYCMDLPTYLKDCFNKNWDDVMEENKKSVETKANNKLKKYVDDSIWALQNFQDYCKDVQLYACEEFKDSSIDKETIAKLYFKLLLNYLFGTKKKINCILDKIEKESHLSIEKKKRNCASFVIRKKLQESVFIGNSTPDAKIFNLCGFISSLIQVMSRILLNKPTYRCQIDQLEEKRDQMLERSIGCFEACPYCGAKCQNSPCSGEHQTLNHRAMGLRGSHKRNKGIVELLTGFCDSTHVYNETRWIAKADVNIQDTSDVKNREIIDEKTSKMLSDHGATTGLLNFNCSWHDPNDIDFYVTCPCGNECGLGRQCDKCYGRSDLDMNYTDEHYDCYNPVEHWYADHPKSGIYKLRVCMYKANKSKNGRYGGSTSSFRVTCTNKKKEILEEFKGVVSTSQPQLCFEFKWPHFVGLSFMEHVKKFYPTWKGISFSSEDDSSKLLYREQSVEAVKLYGHFIKEAYKL